MPKAHFQPSLFAFLTELKLNNDRAWFAANKQRYEREVQSRCCSSSRLRQTTCWSGARSSWRTRGHRGSLFRIYRDTRFSPKENAVQDPPRHPVPP